MDSNTKINHKEINHRMTTHLDDASMYGAAYLPVFHVERDEIDKGFKAEIDKGFRTDPGETGTTTGLEAQLQKALLESIDTLVMNSYDPDLDAYVIPKHVYDIFHHYATHGQELPSRRAAMRRAMNNTCHS